MTGGPNRYNKAFNSAPLYYAAKQGADRLVSSPSRAPRLMHCEPHSLNSTVKQGSTGMLNKQAPSGHQGDLAARELISVSHTRPMVQVKTSTESVCV